MFVDSGPSSATLGCHDGRVRVTRVLYVENDPALRGIVTRALGTAQGVELLLSVQSASEALESEAVKRADAALLDLALGADEMNGIDLGIAMRQTNPDLGIVIYSQYPMRNLSRRVPAEHRIGWSFIPKTADMRVDDLVSVLRAAAQGIYDDRAALAGGEQSTVTVLDELTPRARAAMALAATGLSAPEIATRLGGSSDAIRKELSRAYRVLVPDESGGDLRTKAVLAYLRLVREADLEGLHG